MYCGRGAGEETPPNRGARGDTEGPESECVYEDAADQS